MDQNNRFNVSRWLAISLLLATQICGASAVEETVWVTVKAPAPSPTVPLAPSYTSLDEFKDNVMKVTNDYRASHDAQPLKWNDTLAEYSQQWAEACIWKHSKSSYGENLAYGFANASAAVIAWGDERDMYNFTLPTGFTEETGHFTQLVWRSTKQVGCAAVNCGYSKNDNSKRDNEDGGREGGSGKKLVAPRFDEEDDDEEERGGLKGSKVARDEPRAQGWYVVCEYTPPGNVVGQHDTYFKKNVLPKKAPGSDSTESSTTSAPETSASSNAATSTTMGGQTQPTGGAMKFELASKLGLTLVTLGTLGIGMGLYA